MTAFSAHLTGAQSLSRPRAATRAPTPLPSTPAPTDHPSFFRSFFLNLTLMERLLRSPWQASPRFVGEPRHKVTLTLSNIRAIMELNATNLATQGSCRG